MASTNLFTPNFTPPSSTRRHNNILSYHAHLPIQFGHNKRLRDLQLPAVASIPYQPINADYLEREFSGHGVTFAGIGDNCVVKIGLDCGTMATLMLPSGLITSYKAPMWHGGRLEVLHTTVSEGENGDALIQGGVSLAFNCASEDGISWSPHTWALHDVRGSPHNSIQVELINSDSEDMVEVKYILTLQEDNLSLELLISNFKSSPLQLMGSVISHLTVSTPDATYAVGLEGSDFIGKPPLLSNFCLIPPNFGQKKVGSSQQWGQTGLNRFLSAYGARNWNNSHKEENWEREEEMEGEEQDSHKQLTEQMSRIYTSAPRSFTIIDRGRRNSVVVGREGFNELYMLSPGSSHEGYSKYAYVCVGQSALLDPVIIGPQGMWRGTQRLHNPNL